MDHRGPPISHVVALSSYLFPFHILISLYFVIHVTRVSMLVLFVMMLYLFIYFLWIFYCSNENDITEKLKIIIQANASLRQDLLEASAAAKCLVRDGNSNCYIIWPGTCLTLQVVTPQQVILVFSFVVKLYLFAIPKLLFYSSRHVFIMLFWYCASSLFVVLYSCDLQVAEIFIVVSFFL